MKKIVIGILFAVAGLTAFGVSPCDECGETVKESVLVYKWKFTGKTTCGVKAATSKSANSQCCNNAYTQSCTMVRTPATLKIDGYTYNRSTGCSINVFANPTETNEVFWSEKPGKFSIDGGVDIEVCNIIGKKGDKCEMEGVAEFVENDTTYIITFAGTGSYSTKDKRIKSVSGYFAGLSILCPCAYAGFWDCDSVFPNCDDIRPTVVYGKWSAKYDKNATNKYIKSGTVEKSK